MKTFSYLIVAAVVVLAALTTAEAAPADASPLASEGAERYINYFKNRYVCKTKPC